MFNDLNNPFEDSISWYQRCEPWQTQ